MYEKIYTIVRQIPYGQFLTYGQVAQLAGMPRGAQVVGWALRQLPNDTTVPWQRVVGQGGIITIRNPEHPPTEQVELLRSEGLRLEQTAARFQITA